MLTSMTATDWIEPDVTDPLPTGTVTLLLADVEGSTTLWESRPDEMTAAVARLDRVVVEAVSRHAGVRPVEQGEGDSFVVAFARASDAVACALELQLRAPAPIRLRIGLHTGEVQLRDEGNYIGPTINRAARLRDLAHGGQTVLSRTTDDLVADRLPDAAYVVDQGVHTLRDLPRPERVVQLCHPELQSEFPPLRSAKDAVGQLLPVHLTSFIGRGGALAELTGILATSRLVTLTGAGGVGKTRLAVELARLAQDDFDGVHYIDLAPITDAVVVPGTVVHALGVTDRPGVRATDVVVHLVSNRRVLLVFDNCEHLLDESARLISEVVGTCASVSVLTTSREPLGVAGEVTWRVPSLPIADDAVDLFVDRARLARPDFRATAANSSAVEDVCRRLDGMPLAIELAAARIRSLTLDEIRDSLTDRFRLLTGGARTSMRRQQTLWASVDWSHALLTDAERALFRRLAVFAGGFDLGGARAVAAGDDVASHQVLDQLTLLVDKSLVVADDAGGRTRYRMLETVRQYAQERLSESGEAHALRTAHRDHYTHRAALLDVPITDPERWPVRQAANELDNFRTAVEWSRDEGDIEAVLTLVSSLWSLLMSRGLLREATAWFDAAFADDGARYPGVDPRIWARALADRVMLYGACHSPASLADAQEALEIAQELGDTELVARALTACASTAAFEPDAAAPYVDEAAAWARRSGDLWWLTQIMAWNAAGAYYAGDPRAAGESGREGRSAADAVGDRFVSRACRWAIAWADCVSGSIRDAVAQWAEMVDEATAESDPVWTLSGAWNSVDALVRLGDYDAARASTDTCFAAAGELGGVYTIYARLAAGISEPATADATAGERYERAWRDLPRTHSMAKMTVSRLAYFALARGDLASARRWADVAVDESLGWHRANALTVRARVALAEGDGRRAGDDAADALSVAARLGAELSVPDALECAAAAADDSAAAARLFGAAEALRTRTGELRSACYESDHAAALAAVRGSLGDDFDAAWAEGAELSTAEAIAYALRGRGERKRPKNGWESLTPAEADVARLVCEGMPNKAIASQLFVSPRTVQSHLTHVYAKLGIASRSQLVQAAAQRP